MQGFIAKIITWLDKKELMILSILRIKVFNIGMSFNLQGTVNKIRRKGGQRGHDALHLYMNYWLIQSMPKETIAVKIKTL